MDCGDDGCLEHDVCEGYAADDGVRRASINEFMADNGFTIADETGEFPDWIELYNLTDEPLSLDGHGLSDDPDDPRRHVLGGGLEIEPGGFLVLWADGGAGAGPRHLGFRLDADGEALVLTSPGGVVLEYLEYEPQTTDVSAARVPDGELDSWVLDDTPSPGAGND